MSVFRYLSEDGMFLQLSHKLLAVFMNNVSRISIKHPESIPRFLTARIANRSVREIRLLYTNTSCPPGIIITLMNGRATTDHVFGRECTHTRVYTCL